VAATDVAAQPQMWAHGPFGGGCNTRTHGCAFVCNAFVAGADAV